MPVRKAIAPGRGLFSHYNLARWLPLFKILNGYDIVYNWFNYLKQSGHYIIGYVIMPEHLHAVIAFATPVKVLIALLAMESDLWLMKL